MTEQNFAKSTKHQPPQNVLGINENVCNVDQVIIHELNPNKLSPFLPLPFTTEFPYFVFHTILTSKQRQTKQNPQTKLFTKTIYLIEFTAFELTVERVNHYRTNMM